MTNSSGFSTASNASASRRLISAGLPTPSGSSSKVRVGLMRLA
jgi:hypothetical protein